MIFINAIFPNLIYKYLLYFHAAFCLNAFNCGFAAQAALGHGQH